MNLEQRNIPLDTRNHVLYVLQICSAFAIVVSLTCLEALDSLYLFEIKISLSRTNEELENVEKILETNMDINKLVRQMF